MEKKTLYTLGVYPEHAMHNIMRNILIPGRVAETREETDPANSVLIGDKRYKVTITVELDDE